MIQKLLGVVTQCDEIEPTAMQLCSMKGTTEWLMLSHFFHRCRCGVGVNQRMLSLWCKAVWWLVEGLRAWAMREPCGHSVTRAGTSSCLSQHVITILLLLSASKSLPNGWVTSPSLIRSRSFILISLYGEVEYFVLKSEYAVLSRNLMLKRLVTRTSWYCVC